MHSLIIQTLTAAGFAFCLSACGNNTGSVTPQQTAYADTSKAIHPKENMFNDLRSMALSMQPEQLGISPPEGTITVYGVVMDWGIDDATATIVAYQTGDASLYLSSGGGVIGGGPHKNVNEAAKHFVATAQGLLGKAKKTTETSLPVSGAVKFYLLTTDGVYAGEDAFENFENGTSAWLALFNEGNNVLSELRKTSDDK